MRLANPKSITLQHDERGWKLGLCRVSICAGGEACGQAQGSGAAKDPGRNAGGPHEAISALLRQDCDPVYKVVSFKNCEQRSRKRVGIRVGRPQDMPRTERRPCSGPCCALDLPLRPSISIPIPRKLSPPSDGSRRGGCPVGAAGGVGEAAYLRWTRDSCGVGCAADASARGSASSLLLASARRRRVERKLLRRPCLATATRLLGSSQLLTLGARPTPTSSPAAVSPASPAPPACPKAGAAGWRPEPAHGGSDATCCGSAGA